MAEGDANTELAHSSAMPNMIEDSEPLESTATANHEEKNSNDNIFGLEIEWEMPLRVELLYDFDWSEASMERAMKLRVPRWSNVLDPILLDPRFQREELNQLVNAAVKWREFLNDQDLLDHLVKNGLALSNVRHAIQHIERSIIYDWCHRFGGRHANYAGTGRYTIMRWLEGEATSVEAFENARIFCLIPMELKQPGGVTLEDLPILEDSQQIRLRGSRTLEAILSCKSCPDILSVLKPSIVKVAASPSQDLLDFRKNHSLGGEVFGLSKPDEIDNHICQIVARFFWQSRRLKIPLDGDPSLFIRTLPEPEKAASYHGLLTCFVNGDYVEATRHLLRIKKRGLGCNGCRRNHMCDCCCQESTHFRLCYLRGLSRETKKSNRIFDKEMLEPGNKVTTAKPTKIDKKTRKRKQPGKTKRVVAENVVKYMKADLANENTEVETLTKAAEFLISNGYIGATEVPKHVKGTIDLERIIKANRQGGEEDDTPPQELEDRLTVMTGTSIVECVRRGKVASDIVEEMTNFFKELRIREDEELGYDAAQKVIERFRKLTMKDK